MPDVKQALPHAAAEARESALSRQEGGRHYKDMAIQPVEFIHRNGIGFAEGCAIKYLCRWRNKNGLEDLKKARHFIDLLIEMETHAPAAPQPPAALPPGVTFPPVDLSRLPRYGGAV